ncbi:MAG: heavy-metal-associated domain-containing protein, partial [Chloroflexi bacterium]|nr:heavy-metal-associated domain-containing protein [Chloroflexota bacterium]
MSQRPEIVEETLQVTGLDCPDCARKVGAAIKGIDGVVDAEINFSASTLTIAFDSDRTNLDGVVKSVESFGYEIALPSHSGSSVFQIRGV